MSKSIELPLEKNDNNLEIPKVEVKEKKKKNIFLRVSNKVSSKIADAFHKVETKLQIKATEFVLSIVLGKNEKAILSLIFEIMAKSPEQGSHVANRTRKYLIRFSNKCHDLVMNGKFLNETDKIVAIKESVAVLIQFLLKELKEPQYVRNGDGLASLITECYKNIHSLTKNYASDEDIALLDYIHNKLSNYAYTSFFLSSPVVEIERANFLAGLEEYSMPNLVQTTERSDMYIKKVKERHEALAILVKNPESIFKRAMLKNVLSLEFFKAWVIESGSTRSNNILRFHIGVEEYKSISSLHLFASRANIIYSTYLDAGQDSYIELEPEILNNINHNINQGLFTRRLFQEAQLTLLLGIYKIFLNVTVFTITIIIRN